MKKTLSVICVIVAVAMAFTGCLSFSSNLLEETTTQGNNENSALTETTTVAVGTDSDVVESTTAGVDTPVQENTTASSVQETPTSSPVQENPTSSSVQENTTVAPVVSTKSDYEVLRGGSFYCKGTMVDSSGTVPMEMAFSGDSVYVTAAFDGMNVGMLFNGEDVYMMDVDKKTYMELGDWLLKQMDINREEMLESMDFGFSSFGDLADADEKTTADVNGVSCDCYVFRNSGGDMTYVYMSGNALKGFASADSSGKVISANYIEYFSADVPDYMVDPSLAFEKQNMVEFMGSMIKNMA